MPLGGPIGGAPKKCASGPWARAFLGVRVDYKSKGCLGDFIGVLGISLIWGMSPGQSLRARRESCDRPASSYWGTWSPEQAAQRLFMRTLRERENEQF